VQPPPLNQNLREFHLTSVLVGEHFGHGGTEIPKAPYVGTGWLDNGEIVTKFTEGLVKQGSWYCMFLRTTAKYGCVLIFLSVTEVVRMSLRGGGLGWIMPEEGLPSLGERKLLNHIIFLQSFLG